MVQIVVDTTVSSMESKALRRSDLSDLRACVCVCTRRRQVRKRLQEFTKGQPVLPAQRLCIGRAPDGHLQAVRPLDDALYVVQRLSHGPAVWGSGGGASRASQHACETLSATPTVLADWESLDPCVLGARRQIRTGAGQRDTSGVPLRQLMVAGPLQNVSSIFHRAKDKERSHACTATRDMSCDHTFPYPAPPLEWEGLEACIVSIPRRYE